MLRALIPDLIAGIRVFCSVGIFDSGLNLPFGERIKDSS